MAVVAGTHLSRLADVYLQTRRRTKLGLDDVFGPGSGNKAQFH